MFDEKVNLLAHDSILLTIKGIQTDHYGEQHVMELMTEGQLYRHGELVYLVYQEAGSDETDPVRTMLEIEKSTVTVHRTGDVRSSIVFEENHRYESVYETKMGRMQLGVFPHHVSSSVQGKEGDVSLQYQLDMGGHLLGSNQLSIHYRTRQERGVL